MKLRAVLTVTVDTEGDYYADHDDMVRHVIPWIEGTLEDRDNIRNVAITEAAIRTAAGQDQPHDRRERWEAALDACRMPTPQALLNAAMAVADTEQQVLVGMLQAERALADGIITRLRAELELAGRVKRSAARDAAAALTAQIAAEAERDRLRDEVAQARSAALLEAADVAEEADGTITRQELRRMATEAQQAPSAEAHRPLVEFIAEVQEDNGLWMYFGSDPDRRVAEKRRASVTRRHPDAPTRTVRKTTTYTVEPDGQATEAQQAGHPQPATEEQPA